jgi:hypothetical protein
MRQPKSKSFRREAMFAEIIMEELIWRERKVKISFLGKTKMEV